MYQRKQESTSTSKGILPLLRGPPTSEEEAVSDLPADLTVSPALALWEGTAEDRLTFRDGILLVHRPQQLQGKDRRTTSAPGTGQGN